jgi:hypothetical protein
MKLIKWLLGLVVVGVIAGFVLSLIAPQLKLTPLDLGDIDDADIVGEEELF